MRIEGNKLEFFEKLMSDAKTHPEYERQLELNKKNMVGFASGAMMSGSSMVINRAAAASRGYHINESGNAQQMVRTAEVVLEEAKTAENFQDPAGVVDMLKESVESYNAQKDKTNFASSVALGQMQMFTAYIEKNIDVMQAYTNIMKADAQTLEQYASLASY